MLVIKTKLFILNIASTYSIFQCVCYSNRKNFLLPPLNSLTAASVISQCVCFRFAFAPTFNKLCINRFLTTL